MKITLILSRIWYLAAAGLTVSLIAGASALIYITHAPVARFLGDVALCATAWSSREVRLVLMRRGTPRWRGRRALKGGISLEPLDQLALAFSSALPWARILEKYSLPRG